MAQITIREKDLTGAPASSVFDVAVVPGLVGEHKDGDTYVKGGADWKDAYYGKPIYCASLSKFQNVIGTRPTKLTGTGIPYSTDEYGNITCPNDGGTKHFFAGGDKVVDLGYVYASELLSVGMPIYYIPIQGSTAQDVYNAMAGVKASTTEVTNEAGTGNANKIQVDAETGIPTLTCIFDGEFNKADIDSIESMTSATSSIGAFTVLDDDFTIAVNHIGTDPDVDTQVVLTFGKDAILVPTDTTKDVIYARQATSGAITVVLNVKDGQTEESVSIFNQLADRGTYNVKYITSGGYPTFEYDNNSIANRMLIIAGAHKEDHETDDYLDDPSVPDNGRGDAVAFIDHFEQDERKLVGTGSVFARLNNPLTDAEKLADAYLSFGAMFTPHANYSLQNTYGIEGGSILTECILPASFAYFLCLAKQLKAVIPTYESTAGVGRGSVTSIVFDNKTNSFEMCTEDVLTNYIANMYNAPMSADQANTSGYESQISINGITQINPYGMTIYGTRTLAKKDPVLGVKATGILNIRNMISDIKKQMYQTARKYMFSANNDALWLGFKAEVSALLDNLVSGSGIQGYYIDKDKEKSKKDSLYVNCRIIPIYPVEHFDITIEVTDEDIEVTER